MEICINCVKLRSDVWNNLVFNLDFEDVEDLINQCGKFSQDLVWSRINVRFDSISDLVPNMLIGINGLLKFVCGLLDLCFEIIFIDPRKVSKFLL